MQTPRVDRARMGAQTGSVLPARRGARGGLAGLDSLRSARNANRGMLFWGRYSYAPYAVRTRPRARQRVRALGPRRVWNDGRCQCDSDSYSLGRFAERRVQGGHATREMKCSQDREVPKYTRCTSNVRGLIFSAVFLALVLMRCTARMPQFSTAGHPLRAAAYVLHD